MIKKIIGFIPIDKQIHALLCYFILDNACAAFNWWLALLIVTAVIIGKEWYDYKDYGHFCGWDIVAGYSGVILAIIHSLLFH